MLGGTITHSPGWRQTDTEKQWGYCYSAAAGQTVFPAAERLALEGVTYPPVSRCGHSFPRCGLERVHHSQNLIEVASGGGRVEEGQFQPFVGANDKHLHSITETESGA